MPDMTRWTRDTLAPLADGGSPGMWWSPAEAFRWIGDFGGAVRGVVSVGQGGVALQGGVLRVSPKGPHGSYPLNGGNVACAGLEDRAAMDLVEAAALRLMED
jgi:hypothetical protein